MVGGGAVMGPFSGTLRFWAGNDSLIAVLERLLAHTEKSIIKMGEYFIFRHNIKFSGLGTTN